jgi:hypothetical protein
MRRKIEPLLCELHAHTRWSDGALTLPELVDLYGRSGFDVLCVTDHVNRLNDPWLPADAPLRGIYAAIYGEYLAEVDAQAERARREYDLLLLPGLQLTYNDRDPFLAGGVCRRGGSRRPSRGRGLGLARRPTSRAYVRLTIRSSRRPAFITRIDTDGRAARLAA